jgi:hypothetical protein
MAGNVRLEMVVTGQRPLVRSLRGVATWLGDLKPLWEVVRSEFVKLERAAFDEEGAVGGFPRWAELTPRYKRWKERWYPGQPILQLTGAMREAVLEPVTTTSPTMMRLVIANEYAIYHQTGTRKMVARPPVRLTSQFGAAVVRGGMRLLLAEAQHEGLHVRA